MDSDRFDALTRMLFAPASRRTLAALLAGTLAPFGVAPAAAKRKWKKARRKRKRKQRNNRPCYPGASCDPGPGNDNSRCDFADSVRLFDLQAQGSNLSKTNFSGAQLAGANLEGADLSGACLVGANLLGATIDGATNLDGAIFCRTLMPDGAINDDDCDRGTRCCPTPETCEQGECEAAGCTSRYNDECSVIGFPAGFCCQPAVCTPTLVSPLYTRCQVPCTSDAICQNTFGGNSHCAVDFFFCPYIGPCCSKP